MCAKSSSKFKVSNRRGHRVRRESLEDGRVSCQNLSFLSLCSLYSLWLVLFCIAGGAAPAIAQFRGTGDLGVVIERAAGRVQVIDTTARTSLATIDGLGDLSHASVVFSRDGRYAYVFGRDGGLTKVDLLAQRIERRVLQAGNSIGGAISQDGRVVAAQNYTPGGIKLFDANTLDLLSEVRATPGPDGVPSKVVGLADAPGGQFVASLFDAGEIWVIDASNPRAPQVRKFTNIGKQPYDGLVTPDGRWYIAGLFGEDGLALLDLWHPERGVKRILDHYGKGEEKLPVYKMPHLRGWAIAAGYAFLPGDRAQRGAGRRHTRLERSRAHRGGRTAGVRDRAARRAAGVGQLRVPRQREGAGDRRRVAHRREDAGAGPRPYCTSNSRRAAKGSGSRRATTTRSSSTTRRRCCRSPRWRSTARRESSSRRARRGWDSDVHPSLESLDARLLNEFQRGFPLVHEPYAAIARRLAVDEAWVRATLARAVEGGRVSRVGAVFRPGAIGVSTLAALAVPERDLTRVAACVSARPEVNHNYEREHRFNLWFVAAAADRPALDTVLDAIARDVGQVPIALPLVADYWIDLGFDLAGPVAKGRVRAPRRSKDADGAPEFALTAADRRLVAALEDGLAPVAAPYAAIAQEAGVSEAYVLVRLADWLNRGVIRRLGIIVRHRELGFTANAMCVWDVPDGAADALGEAMAREPGVTLCYRRLRALPEWRYNLYCMLHGRDRGRVEARIAELATAHGLDRQPSTVLFSRRAFKQRGARYALGRAAVPGGAPALAAA